MVSWKEVIRIAYWLATVCIVMPIFTNIVLKLYRTFRDSSLSFTLDTLYLNWNTSFPAITVCEIYNGEKNWDISEDYFGKDRDSRIDDFVSDITFFTGKCDACFLCDKLDCPSNFDELLKIFRTPCEGLITNCTWLNKPFDCCEHFKEFPTEYGMCFSFNSMQTERSTEVKFTNNRETGPGALHFSVSEDIQIHVHPPNEIPFMFSDGIIRETALWGSSKEIVFNVIEIINDPTVEAFIPDHRKCRFFSEIENIETRLYPIYSYSSCILECLKDVYMENCGCINHFMPKIENGSSPTCDIEGLKCLSQNSEKFIYHRRNNCPCLSSCEEPEYNVIYVSSESEEEEDETNTSVRISMIELPTQRYVRNVVKTNLDLIISIGGIAGLFFGASFLSLIEIGYLIYISLTKFVMNRKEKSSKLKSDESKVQRIFNSSKET